MNATKIPRHEFVWRGLGLHFRRRKTPVLTLVADATYPHLFRIQYPGTPANLSRAKDAAYGHARYLLTLRRAAEAPHRPESEAA
jgi:hypothetical protein